MSNHVIDRLSAYLDAELPARERAAIASHLSACAECARHLQALASVDEAARGLSVSVPEGYFEQLPSRIRQRLVVARAPAQPAKTLLWRWPVWAGATAAVVLVAVIAPITWRRSRPSFPPPQPAVHTAVETGKEEAAAASVPARSAPQSGELRTRSRPPVLTFAPDSRKPQKEAGKGGELEKEAHDKLQSLGYVSEPPATAPPPAPRTLRESVVARDETRPQSEVAARQQARPDLEAGLQPVAGGAVGIEAPAEEKAKKSMEGQTAPRGKGSPVNVPDGLAGQRAPRSLDEARRSVDALRAWLDHHPDAGEADEVRVRIVQAEAAVYEWSRDRRDLAAARREAESYLARSDARQGDRVRAILAALPTEP